MLTRFRKPAAAAALIAAVLALPACKRNDGPPGPGLDLPADKELLQKSMNNLKIMAIAMHNHHDAQGGFAPASTGRTARRLG